MAAVTRSGEEVREGVLARRFECRPEQSRRSREELFLQDEQSHAVEAGTCLCLTFNIDPLAEHQTAVMSESRNPDRADFEMRKATRQTISDAVGWNIRRCLGSDASLRSPSTNTVLAPGSGKDPRIGDVIVSLCDTGRRYAGRRQINDIRWAF
jgi:hypothetical protein